MRKLTVVMGAMFVSAIGCQQENPRITEMADKIDKMSKQLDALEKRGPATAAAAPAQRRGPDANTVYNLPVLDADLARGAKAAKVTIIEGFDFACPYCAQSRPALEQAAAKHPEDVRVVSKQFVVHPQQATLPALAVCAGAKQGKGTEIENAIWNESWPMENGHPGRLDITKLAQDNLEKIAAAAKLDVEKFKADMKAQSCQDDLSRQQRELATVGVNGTPAFYINGRPYIGPRTVEGFDSAIQEEIKKVDAAIKSSGTKVEDYYSSLMKSAQKSM
jgi:protein-disulfide isomerase